MALVLTSLSDFRTHGDAGGSFADVDDATVTWWLEQAEERAMGYLRGRGYDTLTAAGNDLQTVIWQIGTWNLMVHVRGVNPADPGHAALRMGHDDAIKWLVDVARGDVNLLSATPPRVSTGVARVYAPARATTGTRGW